MLGIQILTAVFFWHDRQAWPILLISCALCSSARHFHICNACMYTMAAERLYDVHLDACTASYWIRIIRSMQESKTTCILRRRHERNVKDFCAHKHIDTCGDAQTEIQKLLMFRVRKYLECAECCLFQQLRTKIRIATESSLMCVVFATSLARTCMLCSECTPVHMQPCQTKCAKLNFRMAY